MANKYKSKILFSFILLSIFHSIKIQCKPNTEWMQRAKKVSYDHHSKNGQHLMNNQGKSESGEKYKNSNQELGQITFGDTYTGDISSQIQSGGEGTYKGVGELWSNGGQELSKSGAYSSSKKGEILGNIDGMFSSGSINPYNSQDFSSSSQSEFAYSSKKGGTNSKNKFSGLTGSSGGSLSQDRIYIYSGSSGSNSGNNLRDISSKAVFSKNNEEFDYKNVNSDQKKKKSLQSSSEIMSGHNLDILGPGQKFGQNSVSFVSSGQSSKILEFESMRRNPQKVIQEHRKSLFEVSAHNNNRIPQTEGTLSNQRTRVTVQPEVVFEQKPEILNEIVEKHKKCKKIINTCDDEYGKHTLEDIVINQHSDHLCIEIKREKEISVPETDNPENPFVEKLVEPTEGELSNMRTRTPMITTMNVPVEEGGPPNERTRSPLTTTLAPFEEGILDGMRTRQKYVSSTKGPEVQEMAPKHPKHHKKCTKKPKINTCDDEYGKNTLEDIVMNQMSDHLCVEHNERHVYMGTHQYLGPHF